MAQAPVLPTSELAADDIVVLRGASWADYQRLLEVRADAAVPRLTYLEGVLELTSPSKSHQSVTSTLGRLVEAWCTENEIDVTPYGWWKHESKKRERGPTRSSVTSRVTMLLRRAAISPCSRRSISSRSSDSSTSSR